MLLLLQKLLKLLKLVQQLHQLQAQQVPNNREGVVTLVVSHKVCRRLL